jgi:hypothetical protein
MESGDALFIVTPKSEADGEACLTVTEAKKILPKWELMNKLRPNAQNAMTLASIWYTLGRGQEAMNAANLVVEALAGANGAVPPHIKAQAYQNRGMFHRGFGQFEEAQKDIFKAWELDKNSDYIGMAQAEEHLRNGNWQEGWKWHNRSRGTCSGAALACGLPESCQFWDGNDTPDHLLVINEGGTGDRINYTRYLPILTERGISWSFFCFDELKPFYDRLPWIGPERTIGEKDKTEFSPPPSHWTTVFALAGPLGIDPAAIPDFPTPYAPPKHDFRLDNSDGKPLVGLCWNANELHQGGLKVRSLTEGQAMRLVCMTADKVHWINVQHGHKMPYPVINVPFESWQDTSVVLDSVDALATVDCGTLWLSLGMKKQTAVLLTSSEDWKFRWNWSPKAHLYHNGPSQQLFDAEHAIDQLIFDIRKGNWPE